MTRTIAISSQKGGVGKTTTACNLAVAWGRAGRRVLVVDLDPQFAATRSLGVKPSQAPGTLFGVFSGDLGAREAVCEVGLPGVSLLAGDRDLAKLELTWASHMRREEYLRRALDGETDDFDVVLIDCPPNLGLLTVNALFAAQDIVAPVSMVDVGALQGAAELAATVGMVSREFGVDVGVRAMVRTLADRRRLTYRAIGDALADLDIPVATTEIPLRAEFNNSMARGVPVVHSSPDSVGGVAYQRLAQELEASSRHLQAVA